MNELFFIFAETNQAMKQSKTIILLAVLMIIAAAVSRVLIYPVSFSPLIAMALFGGSVLRDKKLAFVLPLVAIFLSDVLFEVFKVAPGFYGSAQFINYGLLALVTVFGFYLKKISIISVGFFSVASCVVFYLLSNTANFMLSNPVYHTYPQTFGGYINNMIAGLPFLRDSLISTACYATVFFGVYALAEKYMFEKQLA